MALRGEVVDLRRLYLLHDADQAARVGHVTVMQHEPALLFVRVLIQMIDAIPVEQRGPALDAVHLVTFFQQKFGEVSPVLPGDASDKRSYCHTHIVRLYLSSNRTISSSPR